MLFYFPYAILYVDVRQLRPNGLIEVSKYAPVMPQTLESVKVATIYFSFRKVSFRLCQIMEIKFENLFLFFFSNSWWMGGDMFICCQKKEVVSSYIVMGCTKGYLLALLIAD